MFRLLSYVDTFTQGAGRQEREAGAPHCLTFSFIRTMTAGSGIAPDLLAPRIIRAKNSFHAHGAAVDGSAVFSKALPRSRVLSFLDKLAPCLVALEACAGAHYWGREIEKLGQDVCLIAPQYVKPYVKRQKNDAADAAAIAEAASRPTMRFVAVKSAGQQGQAMVLKTRDLFTAQRTQAVNALRGHLGPNVKMGQRDIRRLLIIGAMSV